MLAELFVTFEDHLGLNKTMHYSRSDRFDGNAQFPASKYRLQMNGSFLQETARRQIVCFFNFPPHFQCVAVSVSFVLFAANASGRISKSGTITVHS